MKKLLLAMTFILACITFNSCGNDDYEDVESSVEIYQPSPANGEGEGEEDPPCSGC